MKRERTAGGRGFTLVELMVALTGGLIFSIFVFMMTRDVSRFFRQEAGLSDATSAILTGYQRLRADVQRAGFLSSPNFIKDLGRCPARTPVTGVPGLTNVTGGGWDTFDLVRKTAIARLTTPTPSTWHSARGLSPDELILYGNYTSPDQYPVRSYSAGVLYLNPNSEELVRAGYAAGADATTLARIFPVGTMVRVLSANTGEEQYGVVAATAAASLGSPTITLDATLPLVAKGAGSNCGIRGVGADLLVNPVNIIRYRLGSLSANADYAALYAGTGGSAGAEANWTRYDLLREELSPNGAVTTPISQELVAEFAVDFRVGAQVVTNTTTQATTFYPEGDALLPYYLWDSTVPQANQSDRGPHFVRALRPRLAVRTRAPDRQANVASGSGLYRVPLGTSSDYARVRTLQSLIMTRNSRNKIWN
jgi:prepilin-type N-terminal cleavage/methylation domain-containing protein